MKEILKKYAAKEKGLLLFAPCTGTGKTYTSLHCIYDIMQEKPYRKIFFLYAIKTYEN